MKKLWKPALLLVAVAVMVIGTLGSGAWFTDSAATTAATISSGTLSIDNGKLAPITLLSNAKMAPGDVTDPVVITIENNGNLDLAWFGDLMLNDSMLKDAIYIKSATMEFLGPNGTWESTDNFIKDGFGYTKNGANTLATLAAFDGNPGMAPGTPYEFMGALKPGYKYQLTLQFGFREDAGNEYQNKGPISISFKADATQINSGALESLYPSLSNMMTWLNQQIAKQ